MKFFFKFLAAFSFLAILLIPENKSCNIVPQGKFTKIIDSTFNTALMLNLSAAVIKKFFYFSFLNF